nr:lysylphosphatidylglycerol synthase transmembrane domain-containing protein [Thermomicrobium sp. CFH 73360]
MASRSRVDSIWRQSVSTEQSEAHLFKREAADPAWNSARSWPTILRVLAGLLAFIGLAGVAWWRSGADLRRVLELLGEAQWGYVAIAFAAYYGSFPLRAWRWHRLLSQLPTSVHPFRPYHLLRPYLYGWLLNCALPGKVGELYRSYLAHRRLQIALGTVIGTVLIERSADFLFLALLFPLVVVLVLGTDPGKPILTLQFVAMLLSAAFVVGLVTLRHLGRFLHKLPTFLQHPAQRLILGLQLNRHTGIAVGISTFPLWLLEGLRVYAESRALGLSLGPPLTLLVALVAALLTTIPLTPAGVGAVELGIASTLVLLGIPVEQAIALALLDRFVAYWSVFLLAGIPWLIDHFRRT